MSTYKIKWFIVVIASLFMILFIQQLAYIDMIFKIGALILWIFILASERHPSSKLLWLFLLVMLPLLSLVIYVAFGQNYKAKNIYSKKVERDKIFNKYEYELDNFTPENQYTNILKNLGNEPIYSRNEAEIYWNGARKFRKLFSLIDEAKSYIHLEYYIIDNGKVADCLFERLIKKVEEGVEVRVLYDAVGGKNLAASKIKYLQKKGIKIKSFGRFKYSTINFRNHRKIAIIDNYGFVGGINLADEYIGWSKKYGYWQDMHVLLTGEVVHELQLTFQRDWYYSTKENFIEKNPIKYLDFPPIKNQKLPIQVIRNGADNKGASTKDIYFKLIAMAQKEIIIFTPYLVPEYDIIKVLKTASENKVRVRLFLPGIPDKKMVHGLTRTYYQRFIESGIEIYEVNKAFLHAKVLSVDGELVAIGSTNIDFRSFSINFEITTFINSVDLADEIKEIADFYQSNSQKIEEEIWKQRPYLNRIGANLVQLFAPLF